jgi:hypothetical protein
MTASPTIFVAATSVRRQRAWFFGSLAFTFLWALPNLTFPIGRDQALYCVIADGVLHGLRPYVDLWDNRPPTTFLAFLPVIKIFGRAPWSMGACDLLWLLVMSCFIFKFARRFMGPAAAAIAVAVHAMWHSVAGYTHALVPSSFVILFVFAALFLVWDEGPRTLSRHFAAGLLMAMAFWATFNSLAFLALVLGLPYVDFRGLDESPAALKMTIPLREWLRRALWLAVGFLVASLVIILYLWMKGSWVEFLNINFQVLPGYARLPLERTEGYWLWALVQTHFVVGQLTLIVLAGALATAWRFRELGIVAPAFLAAGIGFFAAAVQVRFHDYYFETAYPFFAMLWGYILIRVLESFRTLARECRQRDWRLAAPLVWLLFANVAAWFALDFVLATHGRFAVLRQWWRDPVKTYSAYPWPHVLEHLKGEFGVIRYLRANSSEDDKVFVWGTQPVIYFLSERRAPTRFISNLGLISPWGPPAWKQELMRDLRRSPPRYVIVVRKDAIPTVSYTNRDSERYLEVFPDLDRFIRGSYAPEKTIENFVIYRWKAGNAGS